MAMLIQERRPAQPAEPAVPFLFEWAEQWLEAVFCRKSPLSPDTAALAVEILNVKAIDTDAVLLKRVVRCKDFQKRVRAAMWLQQELVANVNRLSQPIVSVQTPDCQHLVLI